MTYRIAGKDIFVSASATIPSGHKVGLVGRNGAGKSTLLKLILEQIHPDEGDITIAGVANLRHPVGTVAQEAPSGDIKPIDHVLSADQEREALMQEAETAEDPSRIADIQTRLVDIDAHSAPARAASILAGLGLDTEMQAQPLSSLSGGWRMRVALAAALFAEPELLLLDEPTNHLDLEASIWLESYLRAYRRTLIIVSHDRDLLNRSVNGILHVHNGDLVFYQGNYDSFERIRQERAAHLEAMAAKQDAQRKHMQAFVDRFRYKASKARQAQSRLKALEKMQVINLAATEPSTQFRFPDPEELAPPLITFDNASVGYEAGKPVLSGLNIRLDGDDRIALLGPNGNGKSTFAKLIADRLKKMGGEEHRSAKLRYGFFAQHQIEDLVPGETAADHMARLMPGAAMDKVRARLGAVGLIQEKQTTAVKYLSGGEKARLAIALATHKAPHILILDEPTNHLDIDARDALVNAMNDYKGAVILVSHDPRLVEMAADRLWLVADGTVKPFDGDMDDYRDWLRQQQEANGKGEKKSQDGENNKRANRKQNAEQRRQMADLRKSAKSAERDLEKLTKAVEKIDQDLSDPDIYQSNPARASELNKKKAELSVQIEEAELAWLEASEALEAS